METQVLQDPHLNLDHRIDTFEEARRINPRVDLGSFLPPRDHPRYMTALAELIRVELDAGWAAGTPRPLAEYVLRYPELSGDRRVLQEVAFEEYRLRRQAGENATPDEYVRRFDIDANGWPKVPQIVAATDAESDNFPQTMRSDDISVLHADGLDVLAGLRAAGRPATDSWVASVSNDPAHQKLLHDLERARPESAKRWAAAMNSMPEVGCEFLGFRLIDELGRGAFGRVFLAEQAGLANRRVALKVATDIFEESQTLAQLQHSNIVPIYSFHQVGKLQAVCMPYYGSTTLGHVLNHIQSLAGLPTSGKDLFSTMHGRKSATRDGVTSNSQRSEPDSAKSGRVVEVEMPLPVPPADNRASSETWKQIEGMSFTDAVLWIGVRLVDGLAHAHERGVLHRDLKPANILLTDDGTPMVLDFNLAASSELRRDATAARIGGTLPYMAPEHIGAFQGKKSTPDERSDLYSIGVILFNLLTGRHPFPSYKGPVHETVKLMLADRLKPAPPLRPWNKAVTPALEAIVRKCLEADPAKRYQKARDLKEDLECQLRHLPLKHTPEPSLRERADKFVWRHPLLTSTASVCTLAVAAVLAMAIATYGVRERMRTLTARDEYAAHERGLRSIQALLDERSPPAANLERGLAESQAELARFGIAADGPTPGWEKRAKVRYLSDIKQTQVREDVGELFFLMAKAAVTKAERAETAEEQDELLCKAEQWNGLAQESAGERIPRALLEQRAGILAKRGVGDAVRQITEELARTNPRTPRDHYLLGHWLVKEGKYLDALPHLRRATQDDPEMFSAWFVRGNAHFAVGQAESAAECFTACIALRPDFAPAWYERGQAYEKLIFHEAAKADLDRAIELDASFAQAYIARAGVLKALDQPREALADLERVTKCPECPTQVYFLRAELRARLGDREGAADDFARGLKEEPRDEASYFARAIALRERDPKAALADINRALKLNPISPDALQEKAHILSVKLGRHAEAMAVLNRTVELHPDHVPAIAGRGVLLAREGKRTAALRDAEAALRRDRKPPNLYQVGCIFALTSKDEPDDRVRALELLTQALRSGFGLDWVDEDTDLDPLRASPEFKKIVTAARDLRETRAQGNVSQR
jgi:serine/threonine protein kinase/tetratricopeptide (TPR) repeat protein